MRILKFLLCAIAAAMLVGHSPAARSSGAVRSLVSPDLRKSTPPDEPQKDIAYVRSRALLVDFSVLKDMKLALEKQPDLPQYLEIRFFDDEVVTIKAVAVRVDKSAKGKLWFAAEVVGHERGHVTILFDEQTVHINILLKGKELQLRSTAAGHFFARHMDETRVPVKDDLIRAPKRSSIVPASPKDLPPPVADTGTINVMVL
jgi:hypothetical protein